jgi:hypothetical protein
VTIRKGEQWGVPSPVPDDVLVVRSNADLAVALRLGLPERPLGIAGGDLARSLGAVGNDPVSGAPGMKFQLDVIRVESADAVVWAGAHVVVRQSWLRGSMWAAMNAEFIGDWDVVPRSHPNDGRFDLVEVATEMSVGDRWKARRRLPLGTHVPHPSIRIRQLSEATLMLPAGSSVRIDGQRWLTDGQELRLRVVPDAITAVIAIAG